MLKSAYLRQVWRTLNYLPAQITAPFLIGCVILLFFFALSPTTYNNLAPLFASQTSAAGHKQDGTNGDKQDSTEQQGQIAVLALGMEKNGQASEPTDSRRTSLVRDRVAINILLRSGYLKSAGTLIYQASPPIVEYEVTLNDDVQRCTNLDPMDQWQLPDDLRQAAQQMAVAAVSVEKFHRNAAQRWLEWRYLKTFSSLFGRQPDITVGPAQIRISRIKQIVDDPIAKGGPYSALRQTDKELMQLAADECESLHLAAILMYYYLNKVQNSPACKDSEDPFCQYALAAAAYSGKRRKTNAIIDYGPVVVAMVRIINGP